MAQRKLVLRKETLTELSTQELSEVVGGSGLSCLNCASDFQQCITGVGCIETVAECVVSVKVC